MKVLFIGPKIQDLGGFEGNQLQESIRLSIVDRLKDLKSKHPNLTVVTSLNLGIEMWAGEIAQDLGIPVHTYVPFKNFQNKWPWRTKNLYNNILKHSRKRIVISEDEYSAKAFNESRVKMIEDSDLILHFFPMGDYCLKIAEKLNKDCRAIQVEDDDYFVKF